MAAAVTRVVFRGAKIGLNENEGMVFRKVNNPWGLSEFPRLGSCIQALVVRERRGSGGGGNLEDRAEIGLGKGRWGLNDGTSGG